MLTNEQIDRLIEVLKRNSAELENTYYNTIGRLNLLAFIGQYILMGDIFNDLIETLESGKERKDAD